MDTAALRDLLIRWSDINSGSTHIAGLHRMRDALAHEFRTLRGATVDTVPLAGTAAEAVRVTLHRGATTRVLLNGHFDTVYGAHHAFQKCTLLPDDILRGPGVADMKGGIVVMLAALRRFLASSNAQQLGIEIILTPDEETGSVATRPLLEETAQSRQHRLALIFEPARSNGDLVRARKGTGIFTLSCRGRAAHAGRDPGAGRNAILALCELLPQVAELGKDLAGVMVNVGTIRGGGTANIVPDFAEAEVNIRTTRQADEAEVIGCLQELAEPINTREGYRLEIGGGFNRPPKEVSPAEERWFAAWQQCAADCGVKLSWQDVAGGSDGNLLAAAGLSTLDALGPVGDHLHSPDEFVRISSLAERAAIAALFLERLASGAIPGPASE